MRAAFWLFVLVVAAALALFAASNRESVTLGLWPLPFLIELPLYLLVLTALVLGFIFGQFTAWVAAGRWRREVRRRGRYIAALERELNATQARLAPPASADGAAPVVRP
jgi:putative membrane protein